MKTFVGQSIMASVLLLSALNASGQQADEAILARKLETVGYSGSDGYDMITFDRRYQGVKGSPFAYLGWRAGELHMANGARVPNVFLRYDSFQNVLLGRQSLTSRDSLIVKSDNVGSFVIQNPLTGLPQRFERVMQAPEAGAGFFMEVLHSGGHYTLLKHYGKEMIPANYKDKGGYAGSKMYDELVDKTRYYLRQANGEIVPVKLNAKSLKEKMPDLAAVIETETAQQKKSLRSENDVVAVLAVVDPAKKP